MSTGIMTGAGAPGLRRPRTQERTPSRARENSGRGLGSLGSPDSRSTTRRAVRGGPSLRLLPPRTGSRQQISVRGRRVAVQHDQRSSVYLRLVVFLVLLVGAGVGVAMFLSAQTTQQAFVLQNARNTSESLGHDLESLNRDYKELSSSEHLAGEAARLGMVVPGQAGVLDVQGTQITEIRAADGSTNSAVLDLDSTGRSVPRANRPTSNPAQNAAAAAVESSPTDGVSGTSPTARVNTDSPVQSAATQTGQLPYPSQDILPAE